MKWKTVSVKDRGFWTDHVSEDGRLLVAQGFNEIERKDGRPYCLFDVSDDKHWEVLGFFPTVEAAKKEAAPVTEVVVTPPETPANV